MKKKKSRIIIHLKCEKCLERNTFDSKKVKHDKIFNVLDRQLQIEKNKINSFKLSTYTTIKNRFNTTNRINLKKYCSFCKIHTLHKETK